MADFSAPFNSLITQNQQQPQNPLAQMSNIVGLQAGMANAKRATLEADDEALTNAHNHFNSRIDALTPYIAKGNKVTSNDVLGGLADLVAASKGAFSSDEAAHFFTSLPPPPNGDYSLPNPALAVALKQHQMRLMGAVEQIATQRGQNVAVDTGGGTQFGTRDSYTGAFRPQRAGGYVPNEMSPETATSPTQIGTTDKGQAVFGTRRQFVQASGDPGGGAGGSGRIPVGPAPPARGPLGIPMGLPVGSAEAMKASGDQYASDLAASSDYRNQVTPLETAIPLLEKLGPGYQGQVGQYKADIQRTYQAITGQAPPDDPVKAFDELNKYLVQQARSSGGSGTNDQLAAAIAGNPSTKVSNAAATDVAKTALALRRLKQAQIVTASAQGPNGPNAGGSYTQYGSGFNSKQDPRAYAFDLMDATAQRKLVQSLGPSSSPAYKRFIASLQTAHDAGVLGNPVAQR